MQKQNLSPDEYQSRRAALLNEQQLEVAELEKRRGAEQLQLEQTATTDWQVSRKTASEYFQ